LNWASGATFCWGGYEKGAGQQLLYSPYAWYDSYPDPMVHPDAKDLNPKLMEMYFGDYGPATLADFAHWRGVSLGKAKKWLGEWSPGQPLIINGEEYHFASSRDRRWLEEQDVGPTDLPSTLLYRFDPLILAHKDKRWLIRESDYKKVWRIAAHVEGVVLKHGRIVGVWKFKRKAKRLDFQVCHFRTRERLGKRILEKKLNRVARYLGYTDWEWREEEY
jgi:Fe-S cluster biosynthesis and repair protein YggX